MSKLITYALFHNEAKEQYELDAYVKGFYWNCRMNNLIYPDWRTHLEVDQATYQKYKALFDWLVTYNRLSLRINAETPQLCLGMLWRMKPLFTIDVSHIICRDSDAITTYREAQAVQQWLESGIPFHAINDNTSHGGLMGGMVGFDCARIKAAMGWYKFEQLIVGDLSRHGSDQNMLNSFVHKIAGDLFLHEFSGAGTPAGRTEHTVMIKLPQVSPTLWESNLCTAFIGAPGFNELETLRFFKRFDAENWKYIPIEKEYNNLFPWHANS